MNSQQGPLRAPTEAQRYTPITSSPGRRRPALDNQPTTASPNSNVFTQPADDTAPPTKTQIKPQTMTTTGPACPPQGQPKVTIQPLLCNKSSTPAKHDSPASFNSPSITDIRKLIDNNYNDNRVVTDAERSRIDDDLKKLIPTDADRQKAYLATALSLADEGASPFVTLKGALKVGDGAIDLDTILNIIKQHTTPRQFARFYAKIIYQTLRDSNRPPANWIGKGYPYEARFAAFDFFDAISSPEAMEPPGGMKYIPTVAEMRINNANKIISVRRRMVGTVASSLPEISRGQVAQIAPPAINQ